MKKLMIVLDSSAVSADGCATVNEDLIERLSQCFEIYLLYENQSLLDSFQRGVKQSFCLTGTGIEYDIELFNSLVYEIVPDCIINRGISPYLTEIVYNSGRCKFVKTISLHDGYLDAAKSLFRKNPTRKACVRCVKEGDKLVLTTTRAAKEILSVRSLRKHMSKVCLIPNPLSRKCSNMSKPQFEEKSNEILVIGGMEKQGRVDLLLKEWERIPHRGWRLLVADSGSLADRAVSINDVCFVGSIDDFSHYFERAKVLLLDSASVGLESRMTEAMSYGVHTAVFCSKGMFPRLKVRNMFSKLERIMTNENLQRILSSVAYRTSRECRLELIGRKWKRMINELIDREI